MAVGIGTAIVSVIGSVVGAVTDKSAKESEAEIDAWMDANKDLLSSNVVPMILVGTVTVVSIFAIAISNAGRREDDEQ